MNFTTIAPIPPLAPLAKIEPLEIKSGSDPGKVTPNKSEFSQFLSNAIREVDALQKSADVASVRLATGQGEDLAAVMIALEKASLSLSLLVSVRDKAVEAYQQITRMTM